MKRHLITLTLAAAACGPAKAPEVTVHHHEEHPLPSVGPQPVDFAGEMWLEGEGGDSRVAFVRGGQSVRLLQYAGGLSAPRFVTVKAHLDGTALSVENAGGTLTFRVQPDGVVVSEPAGAFGDAAPRIVGDALEIGGARLEIDGEGAVEPPLLDDATLRFRKVKGMTRTQEWLLVLWQVSEMRATVAAMIIEGMGEALEPGLRRRLEAADAPAP